MGPFARLIDIFVADDQSVPGHIVKRSTGKHQRVMTAVLGYDMSLPAS